MKHSYGKRRAPKAQQEKATWARSKPGDLRSQLSAQSQAGTPFISDLRVVLRSLVYPKSPHLHSVEDVEDRCTLHLLWPQIRGLIWKNALLSGTELPWNLQCTDVVWQQCWLAVQGGGLVGTETRKQHWMSLHPSTAWLSECWAGNNGAHLVWNRAKAVDSTRQDMSYCHYGVL